MKQEKVTICSAASGEPEPVHKQAGQNERRRLMRQFAGLLHRYHTEKPGYIFGDFHPWNVVVQNSSDELYFFDITLRKGDPCEDLETCRSIMIHSSENRLDRMEFAATFLRAYEEIKNRYTGSGQKQETREGGKQCTTYLR